MNELEIDLARPATRRWDATDGDQIRHLVAEAEKELHAIYPKWLLHFVENAVHGAAQWAPSEHVEEIAGLARHAKVRAERLLLLNLSYDITACGVALPGMLGCTGSLLRSGRGDLRLARAMDWSFPESIRDHTTIIRFKRGERRAVTVGFPGCIGALTGVNSHGVAMALNQAFVPQLPRWAPSVPWLVRDVLLGSDTHAAALHRLTTTGAMSAGFYLLTDGTHGSLVESTGEHDKIYSCKELLTVANHFRHEPPELPRAWGDSHERYDTLHNGLAGGLAPARALQREPVEHGYTAHQVIIDPKSKSLKVRCPHDQEPTWERYNVE